MQLQFTKMHGLGNDFVILNGIHQQILLSPEHIRFIADRHFGIGCDQLLLVETSTKANVDFRYRIFNADGNEVAQCGNGARCFARFVRDEGLTDKDQIHVETAAGLMVLYLETDGQVTVDMGTPRWQPTAIPFLAKSQSPCYPITVADQVIEIGVVSMGNPHAVLWVNDVDSAPVKDMGILLAQHERFPEGVNVGFVEMINPDRIRLRVFERGVGETLACGSGACAAVVIGRYQGLLSEKVQVALPGGNLQVCWPGGDATVTLMGPAIRVFNGCITL
jgi:diaminopimelate epimerase